VGGGGGGDGGGLHRGPAEQQSSRMLKCERELVWVHSRTYQI
jgi:hypothetical protein